MTATRWTARDLETLAARGIPPEELDRQIALFHGPRPVTKLDRPCTPGDGVHRISPEDHERLLESWRRASGAGRITRFVPASGAATRMFKTLAGMLGDPDLGSPESLRARAEAGEAGPADVLRLAEHLEEFAFAGALADSGPLRNASGDEDLDALLRGLLAPEGLDSLNLPKGLLAFHRYPEGPRTPFEEHLVESSLTAREEDGRCRIHFTVSPEHESGFRELLERVRARYEAALDTRFGIEFSFQDPATDTLAVEPDETPFRDEDGSLVFRPGGHGALIRNLGNLEGDLVLIKNIDNVVPDRLKGDTVLWKRLLAGVLAETEARVHDLLRRLEGGEGTAIGEAASFLEDVLGDRLPEGFRERSAEDRSEALRRRLDRPLRVCGVVKNEGEPGGGPFWVRGSDGRVTPQIVEGSQVDRTDPAQEAILGSSTHFNPVDLACGLRDHHGRPHDLERFIDPAAVFISRKSRAGRDLLALERPGLWNGAMAFWNTLFVEVPISTFAPVKTVFDLLRPQHRGLDTTSLESLRD